MNLKSNCMEKLVTVFCILYIPVSVEATNSYDLLGEITPYLLPFLLLCLLFAVWRTPDNTFPRFKSSYLTVVFVGILVMIFHNKHP